MTKETRDETEGTKSSLTFDVGRGVIGGEFNQSDDVLNELGRETRERSEGRGGRGERRGRRIGRE